MVTRLAPRREEESSMQGVFPRFKSKKMLREAIAAGSPVQLEATSVFGNEYDGDLESAPDGDYYVVGPDPHTNRKWYAKIAKNGDKVKVT
jgi:hypothetical protein